MDNNENLEIDEISENAQQSAEQTPEKLFTQEEVNEMMGKRNARYERREARIRREYDEKYGDLESTLKAGLGASSIDEVKSKLNEFYREKGVEVTKKSSYSDKDIDKFRCGSTWYFGDNS